MTLSQERILATEIPGPRSRALQERKVAAVSAGVGTTLPVYVEQAGGGILRDVDGNQLIDFGSGIAVTTVGNAAPRVVEAVQRFRQHVAVRLAPQFQLGLVRERLHGAASSSSMSVPRACSCRNDSFAVFSSSLLTR